MFNHFDSFGMDFFLSPSLCRIFLKCFKLWCVIYKLFLACICYQLFRDFFLVFKNEQFNQIILCDAFVKRRSSTTYYIKTDVVSEGKIFKGN